MNAPAGWHWIDTGEANRFVVLKGNNWIANVQFNGELTTAQQEVLLAKLVEVLT